VKSAGDVEPWTGACLASGYVYRDNRPVTRPAWRNLGVWTISELMPAEGLVFTTSSVLAPDLDWTAEPDVDTTATSAFRRRFRPLPIDPYVDGRRRRPVRRLAVRVSDCLSGTFRPRQLLD
jgi:hypothetical protein